MAGLTKAQRAAKLKSEPAKTIVEPVKAAIEPVKFIGVKQEAESEVVKFKLDKVQEKFGCIPTVIYVGGSRIYFTKQEVELKAHVVKLLKQEGLI